MDKGWLIIGGVFAVIVGFIGLGVYAAVIEMGAWDKFKNEHDCKIVGEISGSSTVAIGVGSNGQVTTVPVFTPGKTGWQCNNGMTYWR